MSRLARVLLVLAIAVAPAIGADDDFTDIPDLEPTPPSVAPPPTPGPKPVEPRPVAATPVTGVAKDLIGRYRAARQDAITERVYSLAVCGGNLWGGDSRRSHAYVHDGDAWLARGDEIWWKAQRTGERTGMARALRLLHAAHQAYLTARGPPPLDYTWKDSPKPAPFPSAYPSEPHPGPGMGEVPRKPDPQWRRHDVLPIEDPSRFEEDPHW